uniref:Rad60/SUMO-like domain-containing protein n=1 Tax=Otus sunia TaxID=257818 RepID=A0A8C8BI93_9STRI
QDGSVVQFKIKRHTPLSKLMKAYCERQGLSMRQIRFRFDGQPISETDTPAQVWKLLYKYFDVCMQIKGIGNQNDSETGNLSRVGFPCPVECVHCWMRGEMCRSIGAEQAGTGCGRDPWQVLAFLPLSYFCVGLFRASAEAVAAVSTGSAEDVGNFLGWQGLR